MLLCTNPKNPTLDVGAFHEKFNTSKVLPENSAAPKYGICGVVAVAILRSVVSLNLYELALPSGLFWLKPSKLLRSPLTPTELFDDIE